MLIVTVTVLLITEIVNNTEGYFLFSDTFTVLHNLKSSFCGPPGLHFVYLKTRYGMGTAQFLITATRTTLFAFLYFKEALIWQHACLMQVTLDITVF